MALDAEHIQGLLDIVHKASSAGPQFSAILAEAAAELSFINDDLAKKQEERAKKKAEEEAKKAAAAAPAGEAAPNAAPGQRPDGMPAPTLTEPMKRV